MIEQFSWIFRGEVLVNERIPMWKVVSVVFTIIFCLNINLSIVFPIVVFLSWLHEVSF